MENNLKSRREFMKQSLLAGGLAALPLASQANSFFNSSANDTIKVALIGCGGRGTGAAMQAMLSKQNVKLVAMADVFKDRLDNCYKLLTADDLSEETGVPSNIKDKIAVTDETKFVGFDGYQKAMALADVVILTTPPGFRPVHFEEAVKQGKHIFMEKPVATDPAGIKKVLDIAQIAKQKKLNVVVGLQRHYQNSYRTLYKKYQEGLIGEFVSAQAWWNNEGVWMNPRQPGMTEMEYQLRNWYYFNWICGDHITEQHIHNIDVINWFKGGYPVKAQGMGGREVRKGKDYGEIFDHHYVEFTYADGSILNSQCRHIKGTWQKVDEQIIGTKGTMFAGNMNMVDRKGKVLFQYDKEKENNPYQTEHDELFATIAKGEYKFADAENGAKSTMTSILGRLATYTGNVVEWDAALNSGFSLQPSRYAWDADMPVKPDANGLYPVAVPGSTKFF
jgi:predicted dehydrogenase